MNRISAGERYASVYNIDYSRCIFCGYCVEACPTDAITHGHGFELATYDINSLVYRKEQMLENGPKQAATGKSVAAVAPESWWLKIFSVCPSAELTLRCSRRY